MHDKKYHEIEGYADIDNYIKLIVDSITGVDGILCDDCLLYKVDITRHQAGNLDEFSIWFGNHTDFLFPFHKMPDELYYPFSRKYLDRRYNIIDISDELFQQKIQLITKAIKEKKSVEHTLRQQKYSDLKAFQETIYMMPILRGIPKSRIHNKGFDLYEQP